MFHHISIPAKEPLRVAKALAKLTNSNYYDFPITPGAYMVILEDAYGSGIEVLPHNTTLQPGEVEADIQAIANVPQFYPIHAALSLPISREQIEAVGEQEGWLVRLCDRGPFELIELWIENSFLLELLTKEMADTYLDFMKPEKYSAFFSAMATTT